MTMTSDGRFFRFLEPLEEGIVLSRPNRFIMVVETGNGVIKCHCPTTGRLGEAKIASLPCLFSRAPEGPRKTKGTVEAVSFETSGAGPKKWVGINQSAANRYVEFFLEKGSLGRIAKGKIQREVKVGRSRIDFIVGHTYIEVKTPLITLPTGSAEKASISRFNSFDRLIKHMGELSAALKHGKRAVILMCYLYDAPPFIPPARTRYNARILDASKAARLAGVDRWQANFEISSGGVGLIKYFRNDLGDGRTGSRPAAVPGVW
ncbi:MAG: DNA/RNA nuclease SfsA [Thaumarchaeota archaeon]|nr:DNA/RNA nuclease SfsA [Nitrososphaerota archaeon]